MYMSATPALNFKMKTLWNDIAYFVLLDTIYINFPTKMLLNVQTVQVFLSKLLVSMMRNYFPKSPSVALLHTLSKLYDVLVGFVTCSPRPQLSVLLYLRPPKSGCCSISDDLSGSYL